MCSLFHVDSGFGTSFQLQLERKTSGVCQQKDFGWVALYPQGKSIVLQINNRVWSLGDSSIKIDYRHDHHHNITAFSIVDSFHQFSTQYPSWWVSDEVNREDYADDEQDFFGYVLFLHRNSIVRRNLQKLWGSRLHLPVLLCPDCLTGISESMVYCPQCSKDIRKDAAIELTVRQFQNLLFTRCSNDKHLIPDHAFTCGYCTPPRFHTPPLMAADLTTPQKKCAAIRLRAYLLFEFLLATNSPSVWRETMANWVLTREDFRQVFLVGADQAYDRYTKTWPKLPDIKPSLNKTEIRLWAAVTEDLPNNNFNNGYRSIIDRLANNCVWVSWRFTCPNEPLGCRYEGLVWIDGRFKFLPKAWELS